MNNNENKNNDSFGRGIVLIIIGVIALMITFFDFDIDWYVLAKMWPVLLIIIGVCIMPINKWIRTALALALLAAGFVLYQQKADDIGFKERIEIRARSHPRVIWDDDDFDD